MPTAESLKGKSVGVEQGTIQETYAKTYWASKGVNVVPYQNQTGLRRPDLGPSGRRAAGRGAS